jgi:hypothetical protein
VSPRVREESVHPRLQSGASGRPLNFTVRAHLQRQTPGGNPTLDDASFRLGPISGTFGKTRCHHHV